MFGLLRFRRHLKNLEHKKGILVTRFFGLAQKSQLGCQGVWEVRGATLLGPFGAGLSVVPTKPQKHIVGFRV